MQGVAKLAIRRPAVAHQHAIEIGAERRRRVVETAAGTTGVDRGVRGRERPQPLQHRADPPPGFVRGDDATGSDLVAERGIGRRGHAGRPMEHGHQPAPGHRQPEALAQQRRDLVERHAKVFVQDDDEGDRLGAKLHACGAQRIRGLQPMPTLHAAATPMTAPYVHLEAPDDRPDDGQIFLVLRGDAHKLDRAPTAGAREGEWRLVGLIDRRRHGARRTAPIGGARSPSRPPTPPLRAIFRERRRLTEARPPGRVELLLETLILALQPIAFPFRLSALTLDSRQLVAQVRDLVLLTLDQIVALIASGRRGLIGHARVMPYLRKRYKYDFMDLRWSFAGMR